MYHFSMTFCALPPTAPAPSPPRQSARIPPSNLQTLFRAELEEEVFVSMIANLESHFLPREPQAAVDFLLGLAKVKSLKMTLKFLASKVAHRA